MVIDGRELEIEDVLRKIREFLSERGSLDESVEVLLKGSEDARKVKAYASVTGCMTEFRQMAGYCSMRISGGSCRCG